MELLYKDRIGTALQKLVSCTCTYNVHVLGRRNLVQLSCDKERWPGTNNKLKWCILLKVIGDINSPLYTHIKVCRYIVENVQLKH